MKKILQVGITGGIGSGKTTVCKIFESLGIPIYYADDRAKQLMIDDINIVEQIIDLFGKDAYFKDGSLNRAHLASIVFRDKEKLEKLNSIVHPAVRIDGKVADTSRCQRGAYPPELQAGKRPGRHGFVTFPLLVFFTPCSGGPDHSEDERKTGEKTG